MRSLTPFLAALALTAAPHFATLAPAADTDPAQEARTTALNEKDREFLTEACHRIAYSVKAAEQVTPRLTDAAAKDLLGVVQKDSEAMHRELAELMKDKGLGTPMLTKDYSEDLAKVAKADKNDVYSDYRDYQLDVSEELADTLENASEKAEDGDVRAFAVKWLPSARHHCEILEEYEPVQ